MIISVTGASGHIGNNLCRELLQQGHRVRVLVRNDRRAILHESCETVPGDLSDTASLLRLVKGADAVFHLAASIAVNGKSFSQLEESNLQGTKNLVWAVRKEGNPRLIHFSSIHALVQEPCDIPMDENRPLALHDPMPYARTKALAEKCVLDAAAEGLDALVLNPTSVIGPHDYKPSLMGAFLLRVSRGRMPFLVPGGYDFVDVRDVAKAAVKAMESGRKGNRYILSGKWTSVAGLAGTVRKHCSLEGSPVVVPFWLAGAGLPFIQDWSRLRGEQVLYTREALRTIRTGHRNISSARAEKELGFSSRPLDETIRDTLAWFREHANEKE